MTANGRAKSAGAPIHVACSKQFDRGARRGGNVRKIEFPCRQSRLRRRGAHTATRKQRPRAPPAVHRATVQPSKFKSSKLPRGSQKKHQKVSAPPRPVRQLFFK